MYIDVHLCVFMYVAEAACAYIIGDTTSSPTVHTDRDKDRESNRYRLYRWMDGCKER